MPINCLIMHSGQILNRQLLGTIGFYQDRLDCVKETTSFVSPWCHQNQRKTTLNNGFSTSFHSDALAGSPFLALATGLGTTDHSRGAHIVGVQL